MKVRETPHYHVDSAAASNPITITPAMPRALQRRALCAARSAARLIRISSHATTHPPTSLTVRPQPAVVRPTPQSPTILLSRGAKPRCILINNALLYREIRFGVFVYSSI